MPTTVQREQIRCEKCRRLLFVALGAMHIEIKCKCGHLQVRTRPAPAPLASQA